MTRLMYLNSSAHPRYPSRYGVYAAGWNTKKSFFDFRWCKILLSTRKIQAGSVAHPAPYSMGIGFKAVGA